MSKKNERIRTGKPGDEAEKAPMPVQMLCTQTREMRMAIFCTSFSDSLRPKLVAPVLKDIRVMDEQKEK